MNPVIVTIIFNSIRILVSSGLFDSLAVLIKDLITQELTGEQKKEQVKDFLKRRRVELSKILLDGVIFAVRLRYEK